MVTLKLKKDLEATLSSIEAEVAHLDNESKVCSCCSAKRYNNFVEHVLTEELTAISERIRKVLTRYY